MTDRLGKTTAYDYDAVGRRTKTTLPNGVATAYDYNVANQLTGIASVNANQKLLAEYEYQYDGAGNRTSLSQTIGESVYTTEYSYDPLNQLEKVVNPDGSRVGYAYDPAGNRLQMTRVAGDSINTTKYYYNQANELTKFNVNDGPFTEFRYDNNGNRTAKIEPGNRVTSYTWDYDNRLTKVQLHQDKWVGFEYDGDGNRITKLSAMTMPGHDNGIGNDPGFVPPGQGKAKKQQAGLIYALSKGGGGGGSGGGGGGSSGGGGNSGNNGNGKDKGDNGRGPNKDKANGKADDRPKNKDISKEEREKKKEQAKTKNGYRQKGKYTNKGKHKGWYKNGKLPGDKVEVTYYLNDVSDPLTQVLMTYGEDGKFDAAYTYGLERIEVEALDDTRPEAQDPLYYLYDGLGSVTFMVKPDGNMRDHYRYDEFGKPAPGNTKLSEDGRNVNHNTFGYTGEMWDEESNLLYLRARYYDPETGRFLSRDSYTGELENPLSRHLYAYVGNNPINYIDPSGYVWLTLGSRGEQVKQLQNMLMGLGYPLPKYGADSKFGGETLTAVNRFKNDMRLGNTGKWNGVVGNQTMSAIKYEFNNANWSRIDSNLRNPNINGGLKKKTVAYKPQVTGNSVTKGTPIFNPNPGINTTACHISAATGVPMNQVTINPDNPGYKYPAIALGASLGGLTISGTYASVAPVAAANADKVAPFAPTASSNQQLARDIAAKYGGSINPASGDGWVVKIQDITVRVMNSGGGRTNYWRMSVGNKGTVNALGNFSSDRALTHINITQNSFNDIASVIDKFVK